MHLRRHFYYDTTRKCILTLSVTTPTLSQLDFAESVGWVAAGDRAAMREGERVGRCALLCIYLTLYYQSLGFAPH